VWSAPVPLREVLQAAIAETEELARVRFTVDERLSVAGDTVTDLTHLLAELAENAVHFSPPETHVTIGVRPLFQRTGAQLVIIEDWGIGMPPAAIEETNRLLAHPPEVDLSVASRLGFHVVARLAQRHHLDVSLVPTPGSGITAVVVLPPEIFEPAHGDVAAVLNGGVDAAANGGATATVNDIADAPPSSGVIGGVVGGVNGSAVPARTVPAQVRQDGWDRARTRRPSPRPRTVDAPAGRPFAQVADWAAPQPRAHAGDLPADSPPHTPSLNQRRPQTHLAPELLRPSPRPRHRPTPAAGVPDPRPASDALSRFQASRRAAQAEAAMGHRPENGGA
jgi:hypothetical protein